MTDQIELTIAVPVFNVEKYLERCLESIVPQLENNMELLVINDGSYDGSGKICNAFQNRYPNLIRVIHQRNHGLSFTRNVCIKEARGEYISFIDSDDYVTSNAYDHLMKLVREYNADVLCFGYIDVYRGKDIYGFEYVDPQPEVIRHFSSSDAIDIELISPDIGVLSVNKIIRKSLFEGTEYPVGRQYEDLFTTYKYLSKAKCIVSTNLKYYVYCHREGSISSQEFSTKVYDIEKAAKETYDFGMIFCEAPKNLICGYIYWRVVVINIMIRSGYNDKDFVKETQDIINEHWSKIESNRILNRTRKIEYWLLSRFYRVYKILYKKYIAINR